MQLRARSTGTKMQLPRSPLSFVTEANLPHLTEIVLMLSCANFPNGFGTKELAWVGRATQSVVVSFSCKRKRYFPAAWELLRTWKQEEPPVQAPPLTGPIVLALVATSLAWNLTDVAVLIAVGYGGFLRTMEALTLQRHQITAHSSCILLTLPITKTGKRSDYRRPHARSIINRLLCFSNPGDHLPQRSAPSFRTVFAILLNALGLTPFHFTPYSFRRGGATAHRVLHRNVESTIEKGRRSSVKTPRIHLKESTAVYNSVSIPFQHLAYFNQLGQAMLTCLLDSTSWRTLTRTAILTVCCPASSAMPVMVTVEEFVEDALARLELPASVARLAPAGLSLPPTPTFFRRRILQWF